MARYGLGNGIRCRLAVEQVEDGRYACTATTRCMLQANRLTYRLQRRMLRYRTRLEDKMITLEFRFRRMHWKIQKEDYVIRIDSKFRVED